MQLTLTNSRSRRKEVFSPPPHGPITIYVCGPTVYAPPHIGNARPAVVFDLLVRFIKHQYHQPCVYARNITDIEDKIIQAAQKEGVPVTTITDRYTKIYNTTMARLGVAAPDVEPRATQFIVPMVAMIEKLIHLGHAYVAENHVLFNTSTYADYGVLSRRDKKSQHAGARIEVAPYKKNPTDFVLWKPSPQDMPGWESPWGRGRPGWHIECSAMVHHLFGAQVDIHGGGQDLLFPHHENERAQSLCALQTKQYARFWLHNGMLTLEGEKMSKSRGNIVMLADLLNQYPGEVLRLALLSGHYRQPMDWTTTLLEQSQNNLDRMYRVASQLPTRQQSSATKGGNAALNENKEEGLPKDFQQALCDDLNTPLALTHLYRLSKDIQISLEKGTPHKDINTWQNAARLLGILQEDPHAWFAPKENLTPSVATLLRARATARQQKDYARADEIRARLADMNLRVEDGPHGQQRVVRMKK